MRRPASAINIVRLAKRLGEMHDYHGLCMRLSICTLRSLKARSILLGTLRHLLGRGPDNIPLL
jgi:hypothetical protein